MAAAQFTVCKRRFPEVINMASDIHQAHLVLSSMEIPGGFAPWTPRQTLVILTGIQNRQTGAGSQCRLSQRLHGLSVLQSPHCVLCDPTS
jgi:hypothetical protein